MRKSEGERAQKSFKLDHVKSERRYVRVEVKYGTGVKYGICPWLAVGSVNTRCGRWCALYRGRGLVPPSPGVMAVGPGVDERLRLACLRPVV